MLPVQVDALYRTGASGVAILHLLVRAARVLGRAAGDVVHRSGLAAAVAGALVVTNPNLLYLQSTPMTEPLLLGLCALGIVLLYEGLAAQNEKRMRAAFVALALACLTRYEAWPITGARSSQWRWPSGGATSADDGHRDGGQDSR
jgi:4-amino-4-deoxy-L-arabinose transferase-like glycosyltransferase